MRTIVPNPRVRRRALLNGVMLTLVVAAGTFGFIAAVVPLSALMRTGWSPAGRRALIAAALLTAAIAAMGQLLKLRRPRSGR